ncbi:MAG TPA: tRNA (cytidine(34)-2'-O)-methyltransferase [Burkholderiales bacterium]|nr:tRNA (cytidine(34)-2'-O)-methyltransferase [Burkholderiales bacterium]
MIDVVLVHPEIPPNTGNSIRLAANSGARLHLVEPLGFAMDDRQLRRAGLDYHEYARVQVHRSWQALRAALPGRRWFAFSTRASRLYTDVRYAADDVLAFGCETAGLPENVLGEFDEQSRLRLPMRPGSRSVNLSNAVAIAVYEAWRQIGFPGGT